MSKHKIAMVSFILLVVMVILSACNSTPEQTATPTPVATPTATSTVNPTGNSSCCMPSITKIVKQVEPAVVFISVEYTETSPFFGQQAATKSGSGVILRSDGYILTNYHVIENAHTVSVVIPEDDNTYDAKLIGSDSMTDLAVIKIDVGNLPAASFGDVSTLQVGDWVVAMGNALGLEGGPSVTLGIVSNLDRSFTIGNSAYYDIIQTDAAINPGNSGGPLLNIDGMVIGINTFIVSSAQNIGFAVSAHTAQRVYNDLVQYGGVNRPYMGVMLRTLTPSIASEEGLSVTRGVLIGQVVSGGPAEEAGLVKNDVIVKFQDQEVSEASQLTKLLWDYSSGDSVKLTYWHGNAQKEIWITLAKWPEGK